MSDHRPSPVERLEQVAGESVPVRAGDKAKDAPEVGGEADSSKTRYSLIGQLVNPNDQKAWEEFTAIYRPIIARCCQNLSLKWRSLQLREDELVQDVLVKLWETLPDNKYDPAKGRFRYWLRALINNLVMDKSRSVKANENRQGRVLRATGNPAIQEMMDQEPALPDESWVDLEDQLLDQLRFEEACKRVRQRVKDRTWKAFEETAWKGRKPKEVAEELGMGIGTVYEARSSVTTKLAEEIKDMKGSESN